MALAMLANVGGGLPVMAQLRKGGEQKKTGKKDKFGNDQTIVGENLKHFRFRSLYNEKALIDKYNEVYAKQIAEYGGVREVRFFLWGNTVAENYDPCKELHVASKLIHRCDGQICTLWRQVNGQYSTDPVPCTGECKWKGKLPIIIPLLERPASVDVITSSYWDVLNIHQNLTAIYELFGTLRGVEMIIRRAPQIINKPKMVKDEKTGRYVRTGESFRAEEWLLSIEATPEAFAKRLKQLSTGQIAPAMLTAPTTRALSAPAFAPEWDGQESDDEDEDDVIHGEVVHEETQAKVSPVFNREQSIKACADGVALLRKKFNVKAEELEERIAIALAGEAVEFEDMDAGQLLATVAELRKWYQELNEKAKGGK